MIDPEKLGEIVRLSWTESKREEENPKPEHLLPYQQLDPWNQEIDRRIGVAVANFALEEYSPLTRYQEEVKRTTAANGWNEALLMAALGMTGEAGEICDIIKKYIWHGHGLGKDDLVKELGDLLWYLCAMCNRLNVPLSEVIEKNVEKLRKRYPDGFDHEKSKNREDSDA